MAEEAPARAEAREAWEVTEWTEVGSIVILLQLVTRAAANCAVLMLRDRLVVVDEKAAEESTKRAARQAEVVADVRSLIAVWGSEAATAAAAPIVMEL